MLKIFNHEFFGFDWLYGNDDLLSINITVDPQEFDLKRYTRSPFSSIVVNNKHHKMESQERERCIDLIKGYFSDNNTLQYNLYSDDEYEKMTSLFDSNRRFHTMIYTHGEKPDDETNRVVMIGAFPVKGIISPIRNSNNFKLYNGCFINCKPFQWNGEFYNKLVYVLVDIYSQFNFQEFIVTDNDDYGLLIDHRFYIDYDNIVYTPEISHIPYNGRQELFTKPSKNIFYLSDVPKDILLNGDILSVKM